MDKDTFKGRRRHYFIEKKFQTKFILKFCGLIVLAGLLTAGMLYFLVTKSTTVSIMDSRVVVRTTGDFILPILIQTFVVVVIAAGLAAIAVTLFTSHKIVGPLYRFKKVIQALGEGDFSSGFKIRQMDQLQDLAGIFNGSIANVRQKLNALKQGFLSLKNKLDEIAQDEVSEHKRASVKEIRKAADEVNKIINFFKS